MSQEGLPKKPDVGNNNNNDSGRESIRNIFSDERFNALMEMAERILEAYESEPEQSVGKLEEGYVYFPRRSERKHLFECFKKMAEFIHENKIANVVFIDRSARGGYIGVKEYFKAVYPKETQPGVYFINPRGFDLKNFDNSPASLKSPLFLDDNMRYKRIDERFAQIYKKLCEDKDKPVMIFDICVHTGSTLNPVINSFSRQEFKDIIIGIYNVKNDKSPIRVPVDFVMTDSPFTSCSPFDMEDILRKNMDVVSRVRPYVNPPMYAKVTQLRNEMMQIVRDGLEEEKSLTGDSTRNRTAI